MFIVILNFKKDKLRVGEMCNLHLLSNDRSLNQGFKLELFSFLLIYDLDAHKQICLLGSWQLLKPAFWKTQKKEVEVRMENRFSQRRVGQKGCRSSDYGLRHVGICVQRLWREAEYLSEEMIGVSCFFIFPKHVRCRLD